MATTQEFRIILSIDETAKAEAAAALYHYDVAVIGTDDRARIGAKLCDASGAALGGLWGRTELGLLFLDMFFLPARLRGQSYSTQLLIAVEQEARRRGCKQAVVETSSFQAPEFYIRQGYAEFGRVPLGIEWQARVLLRKERSMMSRMPGAPVQRNATRSTCAT
ncbi:GNAT family N-acetyltransferase [Mesorhizobium sp. WSM2239]|uniref:GNAT family N-acetyltransferase n=2 Tax=unclassified Mesorhizobium TaxID=325217 RepID=A0AAU8DHK6_9HYPH